MNPTGVLFIRQAGEERPASQADPATLSSLGIRHRNFNRKATQAGRSDQETHYACQSELTNRREHSKHAALLVWQFVRGMGQEDGDREGMRGSGEAVRGSRGTLRYWATIKVRGEYKDGRPGWQGPWDKLRQSLRYLSCYNKAGRGPANCHLFMLTPHLLWMKNIKMQHGNRYESC